MELKSHTQNREQLDAAKDTWCTIMGRIGISRSEGIPVDVSGTCAAVCACWACGHPCTGCVDCQTLLAMLDTSSSLGRWGRAVTYRYYTELLMLPLMG